MFDLQTNIEASVQADMEPVPGEEDGLSAQVSRLVFGSPLTGMRRAQILYALRAQMGATGLHVGTHDLLEFVHGLIRETNLDTFDSAGGIHSPDENIVGPLIPVVSSATTQAPTLARSVPPTGMRLTKILGQLRVYVRSVAGQIGPATVLAFVKEALRQDFEIHEGRRNG